jgi:benzaldehyde dehydrogenase (NAD)
MMNTETVLLDAAQQTGCVFSSGWRPGSGGTVNVTDKADGQTLFESGVADVADVDRAAAAAARAQPAWAAKSPAERADLLRRFAARLEQHREELVTWIVRESGSIRPKGEFEVGTSIREALEVAGLAGRALGEILPSTNNRASYARRVPRPWSRAPAWWSVEASKVSTSSRPCSAM